MCQNLSKSLHVCHSYSVQYHCRFFEIQCSTGSDFMVYNITDSLARSETMAAKAADTSTVETEESDVELPVKRKSKPAARYSDNSSESESEIDTSPPFKKPTPLKKTNDGANTVSSERPIITTTRHITGSASSADRSVRSVVPTTPTGLRITDNDKSKRMAIN